MDCGLELHLPVEIPLPIFFEDPPAFGEIAVVIKPEAIRIRVKFA